MKPRIAITMGDPCGIGPEVVVKALANETVRGICLPLVLGDPFSLSGVIARLGSDLRIVETGEDFREFPPGSLPVLPLSRLPDGTAPGRPSPESSRAAFAYIEKAARMALGGQAEAIATGPVSKEAIHKSGIPFRGHTEYLAEVSGTKDFVMMLAGERVKVALVTTHLAYRDVPDALQEDKILSCIEITSRGMREGFGLNNPRIGVAALNPHAGEGGLFGLEEEIIVRAVRRAREKGVAVSGPWPADTLFHRARLGEFDAEVCMYHDQGLIPLKLLHFDSAVNVTLGLPFIRTSVDHGVAYDIAGKGVASSRSLEEAIRLAASMAVKKNQRQ
jgi:4-phospho-D-threonate 3-dehydrogenase / 4-phospho-D-erythronate 3-dehydrogenase